MRIITLHALFEGAQVVSRPVGLRPDITRAQADLGWEPTIRLREGLARTILYFEGLLKEKESHRLRGRAGIPSAVLGNIILPASQQGASPGAWTP
ncbi:hypothetical protein LWE61_17900 [Sphingobium sufflavum]|uniref:hypothetical protein n=1 Tax=Sphingobium sufflavum TaxID=1129547 RepID=UPI001F4849A1|nr:hypothetical protein [Sphingobium sufflavum]MCE7798415.1 hypothetical protein [Sphingobium sufflavum]